MSFNFFIIGGDMRIFYLAEKLKEDKHNVKIMGFDKIMEKCNRIGLKNYSSLDEIAKYIKDGDIIISSIPFTIDNKNVYAPYSNSLIRIDDVINKEIINDKTKLIAGKIPDYIKGFDVLQDEATTIFNTVATAEGAISKAIEESEINISGSNTLVLGFGRVAKTLCSKLKGIGVNVYCSARKTKDLAWIKTLGYIPIDIKDIDQSIRKMNFIFNTVPSLIINKKELLLIDKKTLIIDLASKPGGINYIEAEKLGIKTILYSGIPGKISPESSAEYIKNYLYSVVLDDKKWQKIIKND